MSILAGLKPIKLQKLRIYSYKKATREGAGKEFEVMFNPESVHENYKNEYISTPKPPCKEGTAEYTHTLASSISMKLIFDGTGVNKYGVTQFFSNESVHDRVKNFLIHSYEIRDSIHQPRFLTIKWGKTVVDFKCRLESLDINYTLFDRSGDPLRAELSVSFVEDDLHVSKEKDAEKGSPYMTHYRVVKDGDQLPLMCENIYGSFSYYILVARANQLRDFRNLKPGQDIYFPPIEK